MNKPIDSFQGRPIVAQRAGITVTRVGAHIGAEITGVDLRKPLSDAMRDAIEDALAENELLVFRNQDIDDGMYSAASDPRRPTVAPPKEEVPPFLNFAPIDNAQNALERSAQRYAKAAKAFSGREVSPQALQALNTKLLLAERKLTNADGLPRRSWYKHLIYAPGFYTGYGAKTLPGVREGIEEKRYQEAEKEIGRVAQVLQDYAAAIDAAAADLEKAGP